MYYQRVLFWGGGRDVVVVVAAAEAAVGLFGRGVQLQKVYVQQLFGKVEGILLVRWEGGGGKRDIARERLCFKVDCH